MIVLLDPATGADTSKIVHVGDTGAYETAELSAGTVVRCKHPCTLDISPTPTSGSATIQKWDQATPGWVDYIPEGSGGVALTLSDQQNAISIFAPLRLRVSKGVTGNACGIYLYAGDRT